MIMRVALKTVDDRLLLSLAAEHAGIDILTDAASLARAHELVAAPEPRLDEVSLGSFGPFPVTVRSDATGLVAIVIDGPHVGPTAHDQAVVFYTTRCEAVELFRVDSNAPET